MLKEQFQLRMLAWRIECRALEKAVEAHPDPRRTRWCADSEVLQEATQRCAYGSFSAPVATRNGDIPAFRIVDYLGLRAFVIRRWHADRN